MDKVEEIIDNLFELSIKGKVHVNSNLVKRAQNFLKTIFLFISVFFLSFSCSVYKNSHAITRIEIIKLPNDLFTITGLVTENQFDEFNVKEKDTIILYNKELDLKPLKKLPLNTSIEIRTKIIIHYMDGKRETILMNRNGVILIKNNYYQLSKLQIRKIRK